MRSVHTEASAQPQRSRRACASAACVALSALTPLSCLNVDFSHHLPCLLSLGWALLHQPLVPLAPHTGTMKALTPARLTPPRRSPRLPRLTFPTLNLQPHHAVLSSLYPSAQRDRLVPGFTTSQRARHDTTPNRVRHPADRRFVFRCFPPHFAVNAVTVNYGASDWPPQGLPPC